MDSDAPTSAQIRDGPFSRLRQREARNGLICKGLDAIAPAKQGGPALCSHAGVKTAIFMERDGILNLVRVERRQQVAPPGLEDFRVNADAAPVLQRLKAAGFLVIATTNQPGLSLGGVARRDLDRMHDLLRRQLPLDDIFVCPHAPADRCPCRKPNPGACSRKPLSSTTSISNAPSLVVSDKWQDAAAARRDRRHLPPPPVGVAGPRASRFCPA